jgi:hypothetical protein
MTGTSSVCQFYDSPSQLICFCRTKFRVREADLLKSIESSKTVPMVCQDCPDRIAIHKQFFRQTHCFTYIVVYTAREEFGFYSNVRGGGNYFRRSRSEFIILRMHL